MTKEEELKKLEEEYKEFGNDIKNYVLKTLKEIGEDKAYPILDWQSKYWIRDFAIKENKIEELKNEIQRDKRNSNNFKKKNNSI